MNICLKCNRTFGQGAAVCAYDKTLLVPIDRRETSDSTRQPRPGDVLGTYRILDQIAQGAMGTIFCAEHIRIGREVALKVLRAELVQNKQMVLRFIKEARAVNEIGHPNIVDIIDFVEDNDRNPSLVYMVMELLCGRDLRSHLKMLGALNMDEAVDIGCQIAQTLTAVHKINILHRNLRPENIFLLTPKMNSGTDEDGPTTVWEGSQDIRIKLLDFGLVSYFGEREQEKSSEPKICVGTAEYMAPEQIVGQTLDERTDIYLLGLVMYEMLAGRGPFVSEDPAKLLVQHVRENPEPPSTHCQDASVPKTLEAVVMRCLEKDPASRFQDMHSLSQALQQAVGATQIPSLHGEEEVRLPSGEFPAEITQPPLTEMNRPRKPSSSKMLVFESTARSRPFLTEEAKAVSKPMIIRQSLGGRRRQLLSLSAMLLLVSGLIIGWCVVKEEQGIETAAEMDAMHTREASEPRTRTEASFATVPWFQFPMSLMHGAVGGQTAESTELELSSRHQMTHHKKRYRKHGRRARRALRRFHKRRRAHRSRLSVLYRHSSSKGKKRRAISRTVDPFGSGK